MFSSVFMSYFLWREPIEIEVSPTVSITHTNKTLFKNKQFRWIDLTLLFGMAAYFLQWYMFPQLVFQFNFTADDGMMFQNIYAGGSLLGLMVLPLVIT